MGEVTRVKTTRDYELFSSVVMSGTVLFIGDLFRETGRTYDICNVFNDKGELLGAIRGNYFDFGNKTLFERL